MRAASWRAGRRRRSITARAIPTRWHCCARCHGSIARAGRASTRWTVSRPTSRASTKAARSARAAASRSRPVPRVGRRSGRGWAAARAGRAGGPPVRVPAPPRDRRRDRSGGMTAPATDAPTLLEVRSLRKFFPVTEGILARRLVGEVRAVDGVDFTLRRGEPWGLVGESGCGKPTTGRCILLLERPTAGEIVYDGVDLTRLKHKQLLALRRRIQVIFQDPYSSLNPRMKV